MEHFTYGPKDSENLHQGDVLCRTSEVDLILENVHPHYFKNEDYKYFIILTQSCDLVRRDGRPPSSRYISIAAVRPLSLAVQREAQSLLYSEIDRALGICDDSRKAKLEQFIVRLFNNNEAEYFFLSKDPNTDFSEDHCAFLRLSIALKSEIHYDTLLSAKVLQLKESFQHKLGYLVGNTYQRVGTEDWFPANIDKEKWNAKIKDSIRKIKDITFFPKKDYKYLLSKVKNITKDTMTIEILEDFIKQKESEKSQRKKDLANMVEEILHDLEISAGKVKSAKNRLISDPRLSQFLK